MSVAEKVVDVATFRRQVEAEKSRTTFVPSLASRQAAKISADDIASLEFFLRKNDRPFYFDAKKYGHDCRRMFGGDETGQDAYLNLQNAAGFLDDAPETDFDAEWLSFNRERVSTDLYLIDLCEEVYRSGDELIDLDENPDATGWQPSASLAAELDRLTDEAEATRADEIAKDEAECAARDAEWDAEDKAEHADMIAAGSVVSLKDYRIAKSKRDLPKPAELAMRKLGEASARLVEAEKNVKQARSATETNAAIKDRVAAKDAADVAAAVAQFFAKEDKEFDEIMKAIGARAAEIKADVLSAVAASRPQYPPPNNSPLISAGMAAKMDLFKRTAADWVDIDAYGKPVAGNSDNVRAFIKRADVRIRLNEWTERKEISKAGGPWITYADHRQCRGRDKDRYHERASQRRCHR